MVGSDLSHHFDVICDTPLRFDACKLSKSFTRLGDPPSPSALVNLFLVAVTQRSRGDVIQPSVLCYRGAASACLFLNFRISLCSTSVDAGTGVALINFFSSFGELLPF